VKKISKLAPVLITRKHVTRWRCVQTNFTAQSLFVLSFLLPPRPRPQWTWKVGINDDRGLALIKNPRRPTRIIFVSVTVIILYWSTYMHAHVRSYICVCECVCMCTFFFSANAIWSIQNNRTDKFNCRNVRSINAHELLLPPLRLMYPSVCACKKERTTQLYTREILTYDLRVTLYTERESEERIYIYGHGSGYRQRVSTRKIVIIIIWI
jgi:hypothetical protein